MKKKRRIFTKVLVKTFGRRTIRGTCQLIIVNVEYFLPKINVSFKLMVLF